VQTSGPTKPAEFSLVLSPDTEAGWRARQALRQRFSQALPARTLIDLTAVVTELVNHAVSEGPQRPITVSLVVDGDAVRGEVADQGNPAASLPQDAKTNRKAPLALQVVEQLTSRWGVYEGSTHVWFELPLGGSGARRA
jgi:anti-sigma regulatory factor (Ser/Thr protein kinase)